MNHTLSKLAVGLVAVLAFSGQAQAGTDGITGWVTNSISNVNGLGGGAFASVNFNGGGYTDVFDISLSAQSNFTATATAATSYDLSAFGYSSTYPTATTSLTETLFSGTTALGSFSSVPGTLNGVASGVFKNLASGSYTLQVTTTAAPTSLSAYTLTSSVTAVPEPTESALMLSGIGLLGFIVARRKTA